MWVKLSDRGYQLVTNFVEKWDQLTAEELRFTTQHPSVNVWYVEAPYVAWETARRVLMDVIYTPAGGRRRTVPSALSGANRAIVGALNGMDRHPAMQGAGMATHEQQPWLPVWRLPEPDQFGRIFTPLPIIGAQFLVLVPDRHEVGGIPVTLWSEDTAGLTNGLRLANEQLHLSLLR